VPEDAPTLFDVVGGEPFFRRLVDEFYDGVAADPVLVRLYPDAPDLTHARWRLRMFLVQYWGGPTTYSDERGHPRLRLRHMPFHIGREERDRWLGHMDAAIAVATSELEDGELVADMLRAYFHPAAEQLRNDTGLPISSPARSGQRSPHGPLGS
jgi:hemoglobin